MGTVYEARQAHLDRPVALKGLSPNLADDPDFRARFKRESSTLAALDSPHVIQVFDAGQLDGVLYLATQLVHGRDMAQLLRDNGPLAPETALKVVGQVAAALTDAHEAGVLHRDVKPSNILLRESRTLGFAYLCDFGIARRTEATHTRTAGMIGTLSYLAPECHDGADASIASDIYSLGCVLWAALSGRAPYQRTSEYQIAWAHLNETIPTYAGDSTARESINDILRRSMAKAPGQRYASASAMLRDLTHAEEVAPGVETRRSQRSCLGRQVPAVSQPRCGPSPCSASPRVLQPAGQVAVVCAWRSPAHSR